MIIFVQFHPDSCFSKQSISECQASFAISLSPLVYFICLKGIFLNKSWQRQHWKGAQQQFCRTKANLQCCRFVDEYGPGFFLGFVSSNLSFKCVYTYFYQLLILMVIWTSVGMYDVETFLSRFHFTSCVASSTICLHFDWSTKPKKNFE